MSTDDRHEPDRSGPGDRHDRDDHAPTNLGRDGASPEQQRLRKVMDEVAHHRPVADTWGSIRDRATDPDTAHVVVDGDRRRRTARTPYLAAATIVAVALIGGGIALANRGDGRDTTEMTVGSGSDDAPRRGGTVRYGIPDVALSGFCLPEVMFETDDDIVAGALYDPLTTVNEDGSYSPYLAESIAPNEDHSVWTFTLRPGITFHDGSLLDATVVKDNIDAWRGVHVDRAPTLNAFRFDDVVSVEAVGDLIVQVTTDGPWASFPATLASPSLGIVARSQLEADQQACADRPIGTGPFTLDSWDSDGGTALLARNADYWQVAPDGEPYPYVDAVEFNFSATTADLAEDRIDLMWTSSATDIAGPLAALEAEGTIQRNVNYETSLPMFVLLNQAAAPFDDPAVRRAFAMSLDRDALADQTGLGDIIRADGPFGPGTVGHLDDPGFPSTDRDEARTLLDDYVASGGSASIELLVIEGTDDETVGLAIEEQAESVGFDVTVVPLTRSALIDSIIGGVRSDTTDLGTPRPVHAAIHRNPPAPDPDQTSVFWRSEANPANFSHWNDPTVDELLAEGRRSSEASERAGAFEALNRRFAEQVHSIWLWYQPAAVAARPGTGSIAGPELPDGGLPTGNWDLPHRLLGVTAP